MLDNKKLNKRIQKIFKDLKDKWRLTPYRIAVETGIPHSSLKYMNDELFDWKLNHLLAIVDFLNRYGVMVSISDLLDFSERKTFDQIFDTKNADFRGALLVVRKGRGKAPIKKPIKTIIKEVTPVDFKIEADTLIQEITEVVKDNRLYKKSKIHVGVKINGKDINFQKELKI